VCIPGSQVIQGSGVLFIKGDYLFKAGDRLFKPFETQEGFTSMEQAEEVLGFAF
jgi:hypothetical protein